MEYPHPTPTSELKCQLESLSSNYEDADFIFLHTSILPGWDAFVASDDAWNELQLFLRAHWGKLTIRVTAED